MVLSQNGLSQNGDSLMIHLEQVGSLLNAEKTVVLTNEAQPPPFLATDSGLKLTILQRNVGQKWLGCMLTAARTQLQHIDLSYITTRLQYFERIITSGLLCYRASGNFPNVSRTFLTTCGETERFA